MVVIIIVIIVSIGVYHYFKKKERKFSKKFGVKKFVDISSYFKWHTTWRFLNKFDKQFYQYDIKRFKQAIIVISMVVVIIIVIIVTIGVYLHFERSWVLNCN